MFHSEQMYLQIICDMEMCNNGEMSYLSKIHFSWHTVIFQSS